MQHKRSFPRWSVLALWLLALFALAGHPAVGQAQAVLNPNGGSATGSLDATHTDIVYSYTVTNDEDSTLTLTTGAGVRAYIRFYDRDGATLVASQSLVGFGSTGQQGIGHLGPGTYFVHATLYDGSGTFTLSSALTPPAAANDTEPNNDAARAVAYAVNSTVTGHLGYSRTAYADVDTQDWYKVTVPKDGDVTFTLTTDGVFPLRAYLQFYDSDGATLVAGQGLVGGNSTGQFGVGHLAPGTTYYVVVQRYDGYGGYTLANTETTPVITTQATVNNTPATGLPFAPNSTVTGHLGYSFGAYSNINVIEWYKVTVPKDGDVTFTLTTDGVFPLRAYLQFYDSDGATLVAGQGIVGVNSTGQFGVGHLAPGTTYYVVVQRYDGYGGYTLANTETTPVITTQATVNNTPATGLPFAPNSTVTGHLGYSFGSYTNINSVEWYKFIASQDGDATFTLTTDQTKDSGGNFLFNLRANVHFYDSDGTTEIGNSFVGYNTSNTLTVAHLAPGATYYVAVTLYDHWGGYTLKNVVTPPTFANDKEVNDDYKHALAYTIGTTITGHLGYSRTAYGDQDSADYYALTVPQNGDVTFTLTTDSVLPLRAHIRFYDSDGTTEIGNSFVSYNTSNTLGIGHLAPGATYYVAVTRYDNWGGYTLKSYLTPPVTGVSLVPGTSPGTAPAFAVNSSVTSNLGYSQASYGSQTGDAWYAFVAPRDSDVTFNLTTDTLLPLRVNLHFYDSDGKSEIGNVFIGGNATNTLGIGHLAPGATYYVRVTRYDGYGGYTLTNTVTPLYVANDAEVNDTAATALALTNLSNVTGHLGYSRTSYYNQDSADWYKIALPAGSFSANISLSGSLRANLYLYNTDGASQITNVFIGIGGTATLSANITTAGTYYLAVARYDGYGAYDINQPVTATIYGTVTLDSIAPSAPSQTVTVDFRKPGTQTIVFTRQISVGYNGAYFMSGVPRGVYDLAFKGAKWLRKVVRGIDVTVGDANGVNPYLAAADGNNDNSVDSSDFTLLIGAYNSDVSIAGTGYDLRADFNCDGAVDSSDFTLLIGNFGQQGDK